MLARSYLLLHCPTGHLSATVVGIATGELPAGDAPDLGTLRAWFRRSLPRRKFGRVSGPFEQGPGAPAFLVMGRGGAGGVVDRSLSQIPRLVGDTFDLQVAPALRMRSAPTAPGMMPTAPACRPMPWPAVLLWWARAAAQLGLHPVADVLGAAAARACYPELAVRAAALPSTGVVLRSDGRSGAGLRLERGARAVYHCFGAAHSSIVAASLHLGILPERGPVRARDLRAVTAFDRRSGNDIGRAVYVGTDRRGCDVYVIGFNGARGVLTRAFVDLIALAAEGPPVVFADTLNAVNLLVRLGGYLSRRLRLVSVGRPLAALGIAMSIGRLRDVVARTKRAIAPRAARAGHAAGGAAVADHPSMEDNGA